jgi:enamine deaminase RidA (YjgF/YER057c/UK114 family)
MTIADRLEALGLQLPPAPKPVGLYLPAVRTGNLVFTSGQLPLKDGKLLAEGKVPTEVTLEQAARCAAQAALNALAVVAAEIGGLDRVVRIVRVNVFVASWPSFADQARVANGASELLGELFGDAGRHTRCAIGAAELPLNAPVELDLVVEVR